MVKMQPEKMYTVVKKIKIHTKPLTEVVVPQTGYFVKETASYLCFVGFKVRKNSVVHIKEYQEGKNYGN